MDFLSPSNLKTQSRFLIAEENDEQNIFQVKQDTETQGILLSASTNDSAAKSQNSDSSEKNHESLEEQKQEQNLYIESGWGKPLKKVQKQPISGSIKNEAKSTAVLKVVQKVLPKKTVEQQFYENWRASTRETLYKGQLTIITGDPAPTRSVAPDMSEKDLLLSSLQVYKSSLEQVKTNIVQKLTCSITGKNMTDPSKPILGYAISFREDSQMKPRPVVQTKLLSDKAFFRSFGQSETDYWEYWLPVYGNHAHFNRSKQTIFDTILSVYERLEGTLSEDFHPVMVAKVLPVLLVQILKRNASLGKESIDAFSQLYRLFVKLVELLPELKEAVDQEVKNFCSTEVKGGKNREGDLNEFLIKLSVSSEGLQNTRIINLVLQEHLTRQALPVLRKNKEIGRGQHKCGEFLEKYMKASQAGNENLLVVMEICRLLGDKDVVSELEMRCGVLSRDVREVLLDRLDWIYRKAAKSWKLFVGTLNQEVLVSSEQVMALYITNSYDTAKLRGYLD